MTFFSNLEILQVEQALTHSISMDQTLREESHKFLSRDCEPNPLFQLALLHIIENPNGNAQLQYQAIVCMKNSLTRLLQQHRSRASTRVVKTFPTTAVTGKQVSFSAPNNVQSLQNATFSDEIRAQTKDHLLLLIQDQNQTILTDNSYEQLALVVAIFIKYDFPAQWPQLNQWLLKSFDQLFASLQSLQAGDVPKIKRFLGFYFEVMKEQTKKKLTSSKANFNKVAKDHLKAVARVWQFFNQQEQNMIMNSSGQLQLHNFNEAIFQIASRLDKVLTLVVACGFSLNTLPQEPESNSYVETTAMLIKKLKFFVTAVETIALIPEGSEQKKVYYGLMISQVKNFLKHLSELQAAEALLMFNTLDQYLQIICQIIGRSELYPTRINRLALIALYRVINTKIYNQSSQHDLQPHQDGIGILVSPVKFKNFQPLIHQVSQLYMQVLDMPITGPDGDIQVSNQDGARKLLELITHKFLSQVDLTAWQNDPEYFIENEDEQFLLEYDLQEDCSINLLAQHLIEKLLQNFYNICYPFIQEIFNKYFAGALQNQIDERIEDAILNLVGIVGKVQREYKVSQEKRLDVCYVLLYIRNQRWSNPIFKRRYLLIITHWAKILPKVHFQDIFQSVVASLDEITEVEAKTSLGQVLISEHCHCIHELLKEVHYWLTRADQLKKGSRPCEELPKEIGELRGNKLRYTDSEDDQITLSQLINAEINYGKIFQHVCSKLVPLLDVFKQPNLIWNMINYLSFILEKNVNEQQQTIECLRSLNILKIMQSQTQSHVDEAIIDMLKNLLCQSPDSPVILQMCCVLLDFQLTRSLNDGNAIQFWLFTMRAVSVQNPKITELKSLFVKFSGCLTNTQSNAAAPISNSVANTIIKKDYIYIEFLKVAQEAVLLGMFQSLDEVVQLTQFVTYKFINEIEIEKNNLLLNMKESSSRTYSSDSVESDGESNMSVTMYEKKTYLIMIPHTLFWRLQIDATSAECAFGCQKTLIATCCHYLIESSALKQSQGTQISSFYTQMITYLNRMIVVRPNEFLAILSEFLTHKQISLNVWVEEYFKKMDYIVSQEAQRINCLAIYNLLPNFPPTLISAVLPEVGRNTFHILEQFLYLKLTDNQSRFHSPSRVNSVMSPQLMKNTNIVRLRAFEKISQRYEDLKKNDNLLDLDLMDHFWQRMQQLVVNQKIENWQVLVNCFNEDIMKQQFTNLMNGVSLRFEQLKKEKQQFDLTF